MPEQTPERPAGWYRTMDTRFATETYGAPADPAKGQEWTAPDGSVWVYQLTGTQWWEISQYAPAEYWRGKLSLLLRGCDRPFGYDGNEDDRRADAILAAGWRPPARVITDPAEADTLPIGTVVINDGGQVAQRYDGMGGWWQVLDGDQWDSADLIGTGWIRVLDIPTQEAGA